MGKLTLCELSAITRLATQTRYQPRYLMASEIAYEIRCRYPDPVHCTAQMVNEVLLECFGNTTLGSTWTVPKCVNPILYQLHKGSIYKWHWVLILVIDDQIFGQQNPLLLEAAMNVQLLEAAMNVQQSSMN